MGNKHCCVYRGTKGKRSEDVYRQSVPGHNVQFDDAVISDDKSFSSQTGVRHISERENFPEGENFSFSISKRKLIALLKLIYIYYFLKI